MLSKMIETLFMLRKTSLLFIPAPVCTASAIAIDPDYYIANRKSKGYFALSAGGQSAPLVAISGVIRALYIRFYTVEPVSKLETGFWV